MRLHYIHDAELALWANSGTARKLPIQYPGAICHVMNRVGRREVIFEDGQDRHRLLERLAQARQSRGHLA